MPRRRTRSSVGASRRSTTDATTEADEELLEVQVGGARCRIDRHRHRSERHQKGRDRVHAGRIGMDDRRKAVREVQERPVQHIGRKTRLAKPADQRIHQQPGRSGGAQLHAHQRRENDRGEEIGRRQAAIDEPELVEMELRNPHFNTSLAYEALSDTSD